MDLRFKGGRMKKLFTVFFIIFFISSCSKLNIFGFGKEKSEYEKYKINEFIWKASYQLLSKYPNTRADIKDGIILTDWISTKKNPSSRFRITIYILGSDLYEENIKILTEKEIYKNGSWTRAITNQSFNTNLLKTIMYKAKNLDPEN